MRAGTPGPGECVAPRPASAPPAWARPRSPFPAYLAPGPTHTLRMPIWRNCCPGLRDLFSACKSIYCTHLASLDLAQAEVVIPERAYLGAPHTAGSGTTMSNPSRTLPALAVPP